MEKQELSARVRGALKALPNLGKLLFRLARDPRVPKRNKILFGLIGAYLVVPLDVIPDWLPGIGQLDDIALAIVALDAMLNHVDRDVLQEHWDGEGDVLETIQSVLSTATTFVPERIKRRLLGTSQV